jgi:hypothetical protein
MKFLFVAVAALLVTGSASAHIYKSVGPDGKIVYSDRPADTRTTQTVLKAPNVAAAPSPLAVPVTHAGPALLRGQATGLFKSSDVKSEIDGRKLISDGCVPLSDAPASDTPAVVPASSIKL